MVVIWPRSGLYISRTHQLRCLSLSSWSGFEPSSGWLQSSGLNFDLRHLFDFTAVDLDVSWSHQLFNYHPKSFKTIHHIRGLSSPPRTSAVCECVIVWTERNELVCVSHSGSVSSWCVCMSTELGEPFSDVFFLFFSGVVGLPFPCLGVQYVVAAVSTTLETTN